MKRLALWLSAIAACAYMLAFVGFLVRWGGYR